MNRTKWALLLLVCLMFQAGMFAHQLASQESAEDHLKRGTELADSRNWRGAIGESSQRQQRPQKDTLHCWVLRMS